MKKICLIILTSTVLMGCGRNVEETQVAEPKSHLRFAERLAPADLVHDLATELNSTIQATGRGRSQYQNVDISNYKFTISLDPGQQEEFISRIQAKVLATLKTQGYEVGPSGTEGKITAFDHGYANKSVVGNVRLISVVDRNNQLQVFMTIHEFQK